MVAYLSRTPKLSRCYSVTYIDLLNAHKEELVARKSKAKQESDDRVKATHRQFSALASIVKDGKWGPANSMFRRLQKKVNAMETGEKSGFVEKLSRAETDLNTMADWQDFAARPKLEALCDKMEALPKQELEPEAIAKSVRELQSEWKSLGVSRASNDLWARFKTAGDTAYEPCKAFFAEKQNERQVKIDNKKEVVKQLEQAVADVDWNTVDWKALQRIVNHAKRDWSRNRVTDRKPDRALEDRFTNVLSPVEEKLAEQYSANGALKQELIDKVAKLAEGDINQHAANQARSLQANWKNVGITRRKEDQVLWEAFNSHCRTIFKTIKLAEFPEREKKFLWRDFRQALDGNAKQQENKTRQKRRQVFDEVKRLVELCERLEDAVEMPELVTGTLVEEVSDLWEASEIGLPKDWSSPLASRRDAAVAHLQASTQYDYSKTESARRDLLIRMEVIAGIDTPSEDKALRMQFQLANLQQGMTGSAVSDKKADLKELERQWLLMQPAPKDKRDALNSRYLAAMKAS